MTFFKVDIKTIKEEARLDPYKLTKPKYVIDKKGKGYWIRPVKPMSTDYDEDVLW